MIRAFLYVTGCTLRNRGRLQLRRLKQPRYVAAILFGGAYVWYFLVRPSPTSRESAAVLLGTSAETLATLGVLVLVAMSWMSATGRLALAFSPAEVQFLFPAPVSRMGLIGYKLLRQQLVVVFNTLVWVFILRRGGSLLPAPLRAGAAWVFFSTLSLHRFGAAIVRASWVEHGRVGVARQRVALVVLLGAVGALAWSLLPALTHVSSGGDPFDAARPLIVALSSNPARSVLVPFRILIEPAFTQSAGDWFRALLPAVALLVLNLWWVLRTDAAFEEAAVEASAERARRSLARRNRNAMAPTVKGTSKRTLPLSPVGHPAVAIVWKNTLCLMRTIQLGGFVGILFGALMIALALPSDAFGGSLRLVTMTTLTMAAMLGLFGTRIIRNDLRQDMLHLPALKAAPLSGMAVVVAEVASSALVLSAVQCLLVVVSYVAFLYEAEPPVGLGIRTVALFVIPIGLMVINVASLTIHNGAAIMFPAWMRLGPVVGGGIEVLGQSLLATVASLLALAVVLVPPVLMIVGTHRLAPGSSVALAVSVVAALVVLAAELTLAMLRLGALFDRAEPQHMI